MENIFEKMIKTFYQCFISALLVSTLLYGDFGLSTLKAIVVSAVASGLSGMMNYFFRYLDRKDEIRNEEKICESDDDKGCEDNVRDGFSHDWDEYLR